MTCRTTEPSLKQKRPETSLHATNGRHQPRAEYRNASAPVERTYRFKCSTKINIWPSINVPSNATRVGTSIPIRLDQRTASRESGAGNVAICRDNQPHGIPPLATLPPHNERLPTAASSHSFLRHSYLNYSFALN